MTWPCCGSRCFAMLCRLPHIATRGAALQEEAFGAQKELAKLRAELALAKSASLASEAVRLDSGAQMLVARLDGADNKSLQASTGLPAIGAHCGTEPWHPFREEMAAMPELLERNCHLARVRGDRKQPCAGFEPSQVGASAFQWRGVLCWCVQEAAKGLQDALGDPSALVLIGCPEQGKVAIVVSLSDGAVKKVRNVTGSKFSNTALCDGSWECAAAAADLSLSAVWVKSDSSSWCFLRESAEVHDICLTVKPLSAGNASELI